MATDKQYLTFVMDCLSEIGGITYRSMMGEYIIYCQGRIAAYVCDNRFLVKPVDSAERLLPQAHREPPYDGAKDMLVVENLEDKSFMARLFSEMLPELSIPKKRK